MKSKIHKILGIGLSAGLVFGMIGTLFAAPVSADLMKWSIVNTPSWEDMVILPYSDIIDYDIGGDGDIIYAALELNAGCTGVGDDSFPGGPPIGFALVKSTDGGVSWTDITDNVSGAANLPDPDVDGTTFRGLIAVAVAPDDEDWLAVAGYDEDTGDPWVVASKDGGDNFSYTGDMMDASANTELESIFDMDVSIEIDGIHNIAVAGENDNGDGGVGDATVYRLEAGTWLSASWVDTSDDAVTTGWDNSNALDSEAVVAVAFSPNFDIDDTIVCMTVDYDGTLATDDWGIPYVQSGIWEGGSFSWNDEAGFPSAVEITADGDTLQTGAFFRSMGFALPEDYDGSDPGARAIFLYVNAYNTTTNLVGGFLMRLDNGSVSEPFGPSGEPLLASIDFHGDADTGKMMIGEYMGVDNDGSDFFADFDLEEMPEDREDFCTAVRVWHTVEMDPCCPDWEVACKDPSGLYMAIVMYTPDGEKSYATTMGTLDFRFEDHSQGGYDSFFDSDFRTRPGTPGEESAFSVSLDDGVSFNQIGLIDTDINELSDVAVCPDCSVIYLSTLNAKNNPPCGPDFYYGCESIWRSYDNGDTWERIFYGPWADPRLGPDPEYLILRLPCDETAECCTVYLGVVNDRRDMYEVYYSRDCGQCWNEPPEPKIDFVDMAIESENIVYLIDDEGMFSMSTQYGRRWSDPIDTGLDTGHTITSCCDEGLIVVGGEDQDAVAWSDDGGDNWNTTDDIPIDGEVHVACDPTCENIIYAAVDDNDDTGSIFRTDITDGSWTDMTPVDTDYTGIVIANEGTLYASSDDIEFKTGLDPDEYCLGRQAVEDGEGDEEYSGVARNLTPCETACCGAEDWDYLICGLSDKWGDDPKGPEEAGEDFDFHVSALKICGCLSIDTNSILWAIDTDDYDVEEGLYGSLWSYEDCAAKMGPTLTSPTDGSVLDCEPCAGCDAANFTLKWERMCEACSYDVQIMDEDGNLIVEWVDIEITGDPPTLFVDGTMDDTEYALECGMTYTWHVREANTDCECVHSPWSETWSFTITVGAADAIQLLAPEKGAMGTPIESLGFSWTGVRNADAYSFVLSPNANLTSALVSQEMGMTAFNFAGPLDYGKAYYWQVIAWQDGIRLTTSAIGVFNTMAEPEEPPPPVVVEEQPAPVINIPPAQQITPTWIYAIIGVGCALAVVVIVLIVRTRRP